VIVLITGASHTGKTMLAQRILERYGYPYLSIDHLKMGLIRSGRTDLTPMDDDLLTGYLWPVVREMIKTAAENSQNLTVEGCYVPFSWRRDFSPEYLDSIRFICLAMTREYIDGRFDEIKAHSRDIEARLEDAVTAGELIEDNRRYIEGFRRAGERVTLVGGGWETVINALVDGLAADRGN
jgi:gluconate kinase